MLIGTVELGKRPVVILVPNWEKLEEELEKARELRIDLIEARIDLLKDKSPQGVRRALDLIADYGFYAVSTVRPTWEGGCFRGSEEERLELLKLVARHPATGAVDVELKAKILPQVREVVGEEGKKLLVSYHDFQKTPPAEEIEELFEEANSKGADIVKLAFFGRDREEAARVCSTLYKFNHPKVFMVMGEVGRFTRVVGFSFGSLLTYTFFGKPVAPGQVEAGELILLLEKLYPEYADYRKKYLLQGCV